MSQPLPLRRRTGNTLRRPLLSATLPGLLTLHSPQALALDTHSPLQPSVPYSLKKHARWRLHEALTTSWAASQLLSQLPDVSSLSVEEVVAMPSGRHRRSLFSVAVAEGTRIFGLKKGMKSVNVCSLRSVVGETEVSLCFCVPAASDLVQRVSGVRSRRDRQREWKWRCEREEEEEEEEEEEKEEEEEEKWSLLPPTLADFLQSPIRKQHKKRRDKESRRSSDSGFASSSLPLSDVDSPLSLHSENTCDSRRYTQDHSGEAQDSHDHSGEAQDSHDHSGEAQDSHDHSGEAQNSVLDLCERLLMKPAVVELRSDLLARAELRRGFGTAYLESDSSPRLFALDVSAAVTQRRFGGGPERRVSPLAVLIFEETSPPLWTVRINAQLLGDAVLSPPNLTDVSELAEVVRLCVDHIILVHGLLLTPPHPDIHVLASPKPGHEPLKTGALRPVSRLSQSCISAPSPARTRTQPGPCPVCLEVAGGVALGCAQPGPCPVCLEEAGGVALGCGHRCCDDCWASHLVSEVRQGRLRLQCPACEKSVDEVTAWRFISLRLWEQHRRCVQALRVDQDPDFTRCPNLQCQSVVRVRCGWMDGRRVAQTVRCKCGRVFCFACHLEGHWPASCDQFAAFRDKAKAVGEWTADEGDGEDLLRVKVTGQVCPVCRRFVEKSVGCNSMICHCGTRFCFQCGRGTEEHRKFRPGFPCPIQDKNLLKTRYTKAPETKKEMRRVSDPVYTAALFCRQQRRELGNAHYFRQRFQARVETLCGRTPFGGKMRGGETKKVYADLCDALRLAENLFLHSHDVQMVMSERRKLRNAARALQEVVGELRRLLTEDTTEGSLIEIRASLTDISHRVHILYRDVHPVIL